MTGSVESGRQRAIRSKAPPRPEAPAAAGPHPSTATTAEMATAVVPTRLALRAITLRPPVREAVVNPDGRRLRVGFRATRAEVGLLRAPCRSSAPAVAPW